MISSEQYRQEPSYKLLQSERVLRIATFLGRKCTEIREQCKRQGGLVLFICLVFFFSYVQIILKTTWTNVGGVHGEGRVAQRR